MSDDIVFIANDRSVTVEEFVTLFQEHGPRVQLEEDSVRHVIETSVFATARRNGALIGYIRICTDYHFFSAIAEIRSLGDLHNNREFTKGLLAAATEASPTRVVLATYRVNPDILRELGWEEGIVGFSFLNKPRFAQRVP